MCIPKPLSLPTGERAQQQPLQAVITQQTTDNNVNYKTVHEFVTNATGNRASVLACDVISSHPRHRENTNMSVLCTAHEDKLLLNFQVASKNTRRGKYLNKAQDINDSALMSVV